MAYSWVSKTMLIERLIGVTTYTVLLCVICVIISNAKDYKKIRNTFNTYLIILCIMAYYYIPSATDLTRWQNTIKTWHELSFKTFWEQEVMKTSSPVAYLYMYFFSFPGYESLLPAFCAFLFYYNIFHIFKDLYKNHNSNSKALALTLFFFMSSGCFLEVIAGIRCFVSLSILARCFYDEIYNNKSIAKNLLWEILACLIHSMAVIFFCMRLIYMIFQKNKSSLKKISAFCIIAIVAFLLRNYIINYLEMATDKANVYTSTTNDYLYIWEYVIGFLFMSCYILILFFSKKKFELEYKNLRLFNLILLAIEILFCFEYSIFHRTVTFSSMLVLPLLAKKTTESPKSMLALFVKMFSVIILFIACARGNLCGYKFLLFE